MLCILYHSSNSVTWDSQELIMLEIALTFLNISISAIWVYIKVWIELTSTESVILSCLCFSIYGLAVFPLKYHLFL